MSKEITMSFNQFMDMEHGNLSLEKIITDNEIKNQTSLNKLVKTDKLIHFVLGTTVYFIVASAPTLATAPVIAGVIGPQMTAKVLENAVYIVAGTTCTFDVVSAIARKKFNKLPGIAVKYGIAFGAIYGIDKLFSGVKYTTDYLASSFAELIKELSLYAVTDGGCVIL